MYCRNSYCQFYLNLIFGLFVRHCPCATSTTFRFVWTETCLGFVLLKHVVHRHLRSSSSVECNFFSAISAAPFAQACVTNDQQECSSSHSLELVSNWSNRSIFLSTLEKRLLPNPHFYGWRSFRKLRDEGTCMLDNSLKILHVFCVRCDHRCHFLLCLTLHPWDVGKVTREDRLVLREGQQGGEGDSGILSYGAGQGIAGIFRADDAESACWV